jgi:hypothetical protein
MERAMTAATALVVQQSCEPVRELAKHQLELLDIHVAEINRLGRRMISDAIEIGSVVSRKSLPAEKQTIIPNSCLSRSRHRTFRSMI